MKKLSFIPLSVLTLIAFFYFSRCKKGQSLNCKGGNTPSNIVLYNKPLPVIQCAIRGKWKLVYAKGGIASNNVQYFDDIFWRFYQDNKIMEFYNDTITLNTTIYWHKELGSYAGNTTFIMKFFDKYGYPNIFVVDRIVNDTLILHDNAFDAVFYHFIKL